MQGCAGSNGIQIGLLVLDNSFREMKTDGDKDEIGGENDWNCATGRNQ